MYIYNNIILYRNIGNAYSVVGHEQRLPVSAVAETLCARAIVIILRSRPIVYGKSFSLSRLLQTLLQTVDYDII